ncbi:DUF2325 domain-containing protein [Paraburkholderia phosphatilytica]|uniref:DUF2325 domain-containing protein n=1 Tax=Paraburkholderia phosphatilytica TaxID=2282883 RepID=UPI000E50FC77|nr:DUF2325 domain-containing protein [Paraburkholderia phosphatilytica]
MEAPPFRLARHAEDARPLRDACCAADPASPAAPPSVQMAPKRTKLGELDTHIHCSVIGTCLSTGELRKLVARLAGIDRERATDLEIHHAAVQLASDGGDGAKALHKALDARYDGAIRRFNALKSPDALVRAWKDALQSGDVPPAYWAVMTHPYATLDVRQLAFGDVHMLSHLVGAANRADIRRLVALEAENAGLHAKLDRQQSRLQDLGTQRDDAERERAAGAAQLAVAQAEREAQAQRDASDDRAALRDALSEMCGRLALQTQRREAAEQRASQQQALVASLRAQLDDALATLDAMRDEASTMERTVLRALARAGVADAATGLDGVEGKRIVYVGGRPGSHAALTRIVEASGGELVVHDGGIEDRKGMLPALVPGADMVVFPVDCVDHDSMNTLKRVCERHQVAYYPLRTASVASFVEMIRKGSEFEAEAAGCRAASGMCLRHG